LPGAEMEPLKVTPVPMTKLFETTTSSAIHILWPSWLI
jgi:hypothetical protein